MQERWRDTEPYAQSRERTAAFSTQDWLAVKAQGEAVEHRFAALLAAGVLAASPSAAAVAEEHKAWVGRFYDVSYEMHVGLAEMYVSDERFTAHDEAVAPGLAQDVADAVRSNAAGR